MERPALAALLATVAVMVVAWALMRAGSRVVERRQQRRFDEREARQQRCAPAPAVPRGRPEPGSAAGLSWEHWMGVHDVTAVAGCPVCEKGLPPGSRLENRDHRG